MADNPPSTVADAVKPDGFVDFYQLIGEPPDAPTEQLRNRINTLYDESQANRDHRNIHKRREYQLLLELLPQARSVLLDDDKRASYDAYAMEVRQNQAKITFDEFMSQLSGDTNAADSERVDVLGVQETKAAATAAPQPATSRKPHARPAPAYAMGAVIGVVVFAVAFFVVNVLAHKDVKVAVGVAVVVGILAGIIGSMGPRSRSHVSR